MSVVVMIRYIKNIDISFSISIYHIVSSEKISNFSIYRDILKYIAIFLIISRYFFYNFFTAQSALHDWKERLQMGRGNGVIILLFSRRLLF